MEEWIRFKSALHSQQHIPPMAFGTTSGRHCFFPHLPGLGSRFDLIARPEGKGWMMALPVALTDCAGDQPFYELVNSM